MRKNLKRKCLPVAVSWQRQGGLPEHLWSLEGTTAIWTREYALGTIHELTSIASTPAHLSLSPPLGLKQKELCALIVESP